MNEALIKVEISESGTVFYTDINNYESRFENTKKLFDMAFDLINVDSLKGKEFYISTDDSAKIVKDNVTFGFTKSKGVIACPDYTFYRWTECGIDDYNLTLNSIISSSSQEPVFNKLFWIGNPRTQDIRFKLLNIGAEHSDKMSIIPMNWIRDFKKGNLHRSTHFISLEDHTRYKYLIDCGASGYSGRLKFLLHTNRPLFVVEREDNKKEYFFDELIPYRHYIPVKGDLSDLVDRLEWADINYNISRSIAENAQKFALQELNQKKVIEYLSKLILTI